MRDKLSQRWKDLSIVTKLSMVVGAMALLIACELFTLVFALNTLSAVRAFVGGESIWSKAQKGAVYSLRQYSISHQAKDYYQFKEHLRIPMGDRKARLALSSAQPDLALAFQGFVEGQIHPDDVPKVINLLVKFHSISYIQRAIIVWSQGDYLLDELIGLSEKLHREVNSEKREPEKIAHLVQKLDTINTQLTTLENEFSYTLGVGSRWLEGILITLLIIAVLTVESTGLFLTYSVSRSISTGLTHVSQIAEKVGRGNYRFRLDVTSNDEIGNVSRSINRMIDSLQQNAWALQTRDQFMSIASHELKSPLTALKMQLGIARQRVERPTTENTKEHTLRSIESALKQCNRMDRLIDDLLDLTRIQVGKLRFNFQEENFSGIVEDVLQGLNESFSQSNCIVIKNIEPKVHANLDRTRIEQVIYNLLSNALKYAPGRPLQVSLTNKENTPILTIKDSGPGITPEALPKIFEPFEQAKPNHEQSKSGLGLGLYIVDQIVKAHGGKIEVSSAAGEGTTFVVRLNPKLPAQQGRELA